MWFLYVILSVVAIYIYIYVISPIWVITHMAFLMVPQWDDVALAPVNRKITVNEWI